MKAILDPVLEKYGWNLGTYPTDEFRELLDKAVSIIEPFVKETSSDHLVYYKVKDDDVGEFDTCENKKCITVAKQKIRQEYGKYTRVSEEWSPNDGDHEDIGRCWNCGRPLNEFVTWCRSELEYLEGEYPMSREFIYKEAFLIHSILISSPTSDCPLSRHKNYSPSPVPPESLNRREQFFQRVVQLAQSVIITAESDSALDETENLK
jgi:hypothetical protein